MNQADWQDGDGSRSLFETAATLLRGRRRILCWMLGAALVMALAVLSKPALYLASASFVPQVNDASRSGLASLAGQFGVALPASGQSQSPDFYSRLLKSRELLGPIVRDTFAVREMSGKRMLFLDLFEIEARSAGAREERGIEVLSKIISAKVVRTAGVVELSVATRWPSVSLAIATALVRGVNDFNQRTRQGQAGSERRFIQERLVVAGVDLRAAEDRLENFYRANRDFASSPQLTFERDRLQRDVVLQQQVFTSLTQAYEDARIREVRDTPVITVAEVPAVRSLPEPRGRVKSVLVGLLLGGFVGSLLELATVSLARRRREGDAEFNVFVGLLGEVRGEMLKPVRWLRGRAGW